MNYYTEDMLLELQGEAIDFINRNFNDCTGYSDFIELVSSKDTSKELVLDQIDRDYLNEFIEYKEFYTILDDEEELYELLVYDRDYGDYINYFMDCTLITLLDYFTEISFIELLSYVDIYNYKDVYYAIWDI